jgi:hypothetical protein
MIIGGATSVLLSVRPSFNPLHDLAPADLESGVAGLAALIAVPVSLIVLVVISLVSSAPSTVPAEERA